MTGIWLWEMCLYKGKDKLPQNVSNHLMEELENDLRKISDHCQYKISGINTIFYPNFCGKKLKNSGF